VARAGAGLPLQKRVSESGKVLVGGDLSEIFGLEMGDDDAKPAPPPARPAPRRRAATPKKKAKTKNRRPAQKARGKRR
jgi:hypothetical protein